MNKDKLTDAIGGIGDDLIVNAKKSRTGIIVFRRIAAAAACLAVLIGAFYLAFPEAESEPDNTVLQNTTAPSITPTTAPTTVPSSVVHPSSTKPQTSSTRPIQSNPPASTTLSFTTAPNSTPPTVSSTTVAPSTGNDHQFAYPPLVIRDGEKYNQLFAAAEDVSVLIQHQDFIQTFGNQDELKHFVNVLNHLPMPQIESAVCTILEYIPDYQMLNMALQTADGVTYSFTYQLDADRAAEIRNDFANRNMICEQEWTVEGCETFKSVTEFKQHSAIFPDNYGCWVEIDGWLTNFSCKGLTGNASFGTILAQLSIGNTLYW